MRAYEFINEETTTLQKLYGGKYPDRDEQFWDYVRKDEFDIPLTVKKLSPTVLARRLCDQYRVENLDEITDEEDGILSDEQREIIDKYINDSNLSNSIILISDKRIIDGNHRALAAAIKGVGINYVDLADLDVEQIDEIRFTKSERPFSGMVSGMQYDDELKQTGMGHYSRVFQHPTQDKTLIKIFANDRGYAEYLRWMAKNQNNKYVPKIIPHEDGSIIKAYKYFMPLPGKQAITQRIGLVNLEKLEVANRDEIDKFNTYVMNFLNDDNLKKVMRSIPPRRTLNWFYGFNEESWKQVAENSRNVDPDLSELASELSRMEMKFGGLDLHNENLMWDPERGNIVFIDVLSVG